MGNRASTEEGTIMGEDGRTPRLYEEVKRLDPEKWPIIYSPAYNISFLGMEKMHPFDSGKWSKVYAFLIEAKMVKAESIIAPVEASRAELLVTHTEKYLESLNTSYNVAVVVEVPPVAILPNFIVQNRMLRPFRYQTAGTVMAGKLAMDRGWAINIGGGFHHCSSGEGGGFCAYADLTISIKFMFQHLDGIRKVMIVDFDAHQGNGHENDFIGDGRVYIMDMYNRWIYPNDRQAKAAINKKIELDVHTEDDAYLAHIRNHLPRALDEFKPDVVVYNAGTDILVGDPLGILDISAEGVVERDRLVFDEVRRKRRIPIFMVTSGGYQRNNSRVIADSILNLHEKGLITAPSEDPHIREQLGDEAARLQPQGEGEGEEQAKTDCAVLEGDEPRDVTNGAVAEGDEQWDN